MRIFMLMFMLGTTLTTSAIEAQNLILNPDLTPPFRKQWYSNAEDRFRQVNENGEKEVEILGNAELKGNQRLIQSIKEMPAEKEVLLSVKIRVEKLSGAVTFALREVKADGKTLRYHNLKVSKYDKHDWKEYRVVCKLSPDTASLGVYVTADYLAEDDKIRFSDLKLVANNN